MKSVSYRELLKGNRNFRRLWAGQVISELGTWFSFIAELGLVRMLSGSPLATTALLVARLLPFLLAAPIAGVFADRRSRKQIMIATDLIRAVVALTYVFAGVIGSAWLVVACSALMASLTMFFEAAKNASIPNLVASRELLTANVLMFSTRFLQFTLGSALGGLTAAQFGYNAAFIVNAASFVASALFILPIPASVTRQARTVARAEFADPMSAEAAAITPIAGSEQPFEAANAAFFADLREGMRYILATPFVRAVILVNIGWGSGGGMTAILFDRIGGQVLSSGAGDRGDWRVAALFTAGGMGVFLGMMLTRRIGIWITDEHRAGRFIGWALLVHGLLFSMAGLMPALAAMAIWVALSRLVLGAEFGFQETMMMRVLPDDYRGRVFTTDRSLELATMALSTIVTGWLLTWFGPRSLMIASGLFSASPGVIWLLALWLARFRVPTRAVRESYGD
ncbi:MAG TPA: MFS transporter [Blastocatellia bacterium]|nr:MFS transporter [Blastocatellia bacterium]